MVYKWCVVPQCTNTSINTPQKLFINVPKNVKLRKKWLLLARRNPNDIVVTSNVFFCEDHFEMEKVIANYNQYKMGSSQRLLRVNGTLPSKFQCQQDVRKRLREASPSPKTTKRKNTEFLKCSHHDQLILEKLSRACNQHEAEEMQEVTVSELKDREQTHDAKAGESEPIVTTEKAVKASLKDQPKGVPMKDKPCDVKVCRICLTTGYKMFSMKASSVLSKAYETLTGLMIEDNLPPHLCYKCAGQVQNCAQFRTKSLRAHSILQDIFKNHDYITLQLIKSVKENSSRLNQTDNDRDIELAHKKNTNTHEQSDIRHVPDSPKENDSSKEMKDNGVKAQNDAMNKNIFDVPDTTNHFLVGESQLYVEVTVKAESIDVSDLLSPDQMTNDDMMLVSKSYEDVAADSASAANSDMDNHVIIKDKDTVNEDLVGTSGSADISEDSVKSKNDDTTDHVTMCTSKSHEGIAHNSCNGENDDLNQNIVCVDKSNDDTVGISDSKEPIAQNSVRSENSGALDQNIFNVKNKTNNNTVCLSRSRETLSKVLLRLKTMT